MHMSQGIQVAHSRSICAYGGPKQVVRIDLEPLCRLADNFGVVFGFGTKVPDWFTAGLVSKLCSRLLKNLHLEPQILDPEP